MIEVIRVYNGHQDQCQIYGHSDMYHRMYLANSTDLRSIFLIRRLDIGGT